MTNVGSAYTNFRRDTISLHLSKRDRYARRPDKVWRSVWLKQMLLPKQYDSFDRYSMFWYNKDTATKEIKND